MGVLWFLQQKKVAEKGSQNGFWVSRRCLERPLGEYDPLGVRPTLGPCCLWCCHCSIERMRLANSEHKNLTMSATPLTVAKPVSTVQW